MSGADTTRRRYCADCGRWTMTFVPYNDPRNEIMTRVVLRPGTTKVRNRGRKQAAALGRHRANNFGYLCDSCAEAE